MQGREHPQVEGLQQFLHLGLEATLTARHLWGVHMLSLCIDQMFKGIHDTAKGKNQGFSRCF